jgi:hypothetical protein
MAQWYGMVKDERGEEYLVPLSIGDVRQLISENGGDLRPVQNLEEEENR